MTAMIVAVTEIVKKTYSDAAITWITLFNNSSNSPVHWNKDRSDRLQFCFEAAQIAVKKNSLSISLTDEQQVQH